MVRPKSAPVPVTIKVRSNRCVLQMVPMNEAAGVTNARYWDRAAACWDDIHDTFKTDVWGVMKCALAKHCKPTDEVIDFGCGGGRYLAFVAPRCKHVLGLDISAALLEIARKDVVEQKRLRNVELRVADLGAHGSIERLQLPPSDLAICTNVLLSPEPRTRSNILRLMATSVSDGGRLVLLVPAVSSALNIRTQHVRWVQERRRRGYDRDDDDEAAEATTASDEQRGVFQRCGVRTQHFRLTELQAALREHGFPVILSAERVEYSWSTEFEPPTRWLDRDSSVQRPFDWLVVAERRVGHIDAEHGGEAAAAEPLRAVSKMPRARSAWKMASAAASAASATSATSVAPTAAATEAVAAASTSATSSASKLAATAAATAVAAASTPDASTTVAAGCPGGSGGGAGSTEGGMPSGGGQSRVPTGAKGGYVPIGGMGGHTRSSLLRAAMISRARSAMAAAPLAAAPLAMPPSSAAPPSSAVSAPPPLVAPPPQRRRHEGFRSIVVVAPPVPPPPTASAVAPAHRRAPMRVETLTLTNPKPNRGVPVPTRWR